MAERCAAPTSGAAGGKQLAQRVSGGASLASNVTRHRGQVLGAAWEFVASTKYSRVCRAVRSLLQGSPVSSSVSLWRPVSVPTCAPCVPEGSRTCVRVCCKVFSLPQRVTMVSLSHTVLPTRPHTLECICAGPAFPISNLLFPSFL